MNAMNAGTCCPALHFSVSVGQQPALSVYLRIRFCGLSPHWQWRKHRAVSCVDTTGYTVGTCSCGRSVEVVRPAIKSNRNHHSYDTSCTSMEPSTVQDNIHLSTSDFGELEFLEDDVTSQPAITCVETHIITVFGTAGTSLRLRTQSRPHTMYV